MKMRIIMAMAVLIALMLPAMAAPDGVLEINLLAFRSGAAAMDFKVSEGRASSYANESGIYSLEVNDASGAPLWKRNYNLQFFELTDPPRMAEYEIINEKIPYDSKMYEIAFYKGKELLLQKYLDVCDFNSACDKKENAVSCPSDCSISDYDGVCIAKDEGICDPDCIADTDCERIRKQKAYSRAFVSIAASIAFVLIVFFVHRHRKKIMHLAIRARERYLKLISELKEMGKPVKRIRKR